MGASVLVKREALHLLFSQRLGPAAGQRRHEQQKKSNAVGRQHVFIMRLQVMV
jgi:hypothetical protein